MTFPPGAKDAPHEHPIHSMYFVVDCKLKISGGPTDTKLGEEGGVVEVPAGAAPIFPAMAHQVRARRRPSAFSGTPGNGAPGERAPPTTRRPVPCTCAHRPFQP